MKPQPAVSIPEGEPDFLGRLLDRSFALGAAVRPRLPSLFEPAPRVVLPPFTAQAEASIAIATSRCAHRHLMADGAP
jgi:hypothetical protein